MDPQKLSQAQTTAQKCPWHEDLERRIIANESDIKEVKDSLHDYRIEQISILEALKIDLATIKERVCSDSKLTWQVYVTIFGVLIMIIMTILDKFLK